jgi:hypothetical protein
MSKRIKSKKFMRLSAGIGVSHMLRFIHRRFSRYWRKKADHR